MIFPPRLKRGDRVAVIGTAKIVPPADLQPGLDLLAEWGLKPVTGKSLFDPHYQFAANDEQRLEDFQAAIDDPEVRCIHFARGGYGTLRILDRVDFSPLLKHPKWMVGFSDLTPVLVSAYKLGLCSIHGPMGVNLRGLFGDTDSVACLKRMLMEGGTFEYSCESQFAHLQREGKARGRLLGGCISLLHHLTGTETDFDTRDCIFFIEDIDEYLYHLDRLCVHLLRAGKFNSPAAVICGGLTLMKDNEEPFGKTPEEVVADALKSFEYPTAFGFPFGHQPMNYPLPVGCEAELEVKGGKAVLRFEL